MATEPHTAWHAAIVHADQSETYCGTVGQQHVEQVRELADLDSVERHVREHPRQAGSFFVFRDDGDLDVYVPVDAPEFRVYEPDPDPKAMDPEDLPRGTVGPAYVAGVTRFGDQSIGGASDSPGKPPRAVWHTTESPAGGNYFSSIASYLIRVGAEPQVIYCPVTDRLGQFGPLTQSGRALRNDGSVRVNRTGKVCIQVEVLGRAKSPWTKGFDPDDKPNYRKLIAAMRAHGIPDVWPVGKPPATAAAATKRPKDVWETKGGHYGHSQVRGQDHWDPGAIDTAIVPGKATSSPKPPTTPSNFEPFPGTGFFHGGRHSSIITAMGRRLVAEGCGAYRSGPGPNWTNADRESYRRWQKKLGYTGADADGYPGPTSWAKLRVPNV